MIVAENVHKSFGDSHILKGISTVFEKGKTNLIIGQSGSGKTVFLKSLLGLFTPEEGPLATDGKIYLTYKKMINESFVKKWGWFFKEAHFLIQ